MDHSGSHRFQHSGVGYAVGYALGYAVGDAWRYLSVVCQVVVVAVYTQWYSNLNVSCLSDVRTIAPMIRVMYIEQTFRNAHARLLHPLISRGDAEFPIAERWLAFFDARCALPRDLRVIVMAYWQPCICGYYTEDGAAMMHFQPHCPYTEDGLS